MKILISGGGKCNLTHAGKVEDVLAAFRRGEAMFLRPSLYRFTNNQFLDILHRSGMPTYARPDGRIFPVEPGDAKDVMALLEQWLRSSGATVRLRSNVTGLVIEDGRIKGVRTDGGTLHRADRVIVAAGGSSYPATGTTGDGWRWAAEAGHTIIALRAALAPLSLEDAQPDWSGVSLRDVVLRARAGADGKAYARWRGDLLFTHKGISGPSALGISREVAEHMAAGLKGGGIVEVDLAPDTPFETIQERLRAAMRENPRLAAASVAETHIPRRLIAPFLAAAGIEPDTRVATLSAKTLNQLCAAVKGWSLGAVRSVPLERGEVVAGGVSLEEVDPKTMQSRLVDGLYLCGEVLDIAGPVGGYNLQAAWSTGYVAGESAASGSETVL